MSFLDSAGGNNNQDFYARGLSYPLRGYRLWDYDYALTRDPMVYERLRRDAVIAFALRYRKLLAAGRDWYLEAASADPRDRHLLQIMEHLLLELEYFDTARFNLSEAIIAGSRWAKIQSDVKLLRIPETQDLEWVVVTRLRDVDKRRLRQFPIDEPDEQRQVTYTPGGPSVTIPYARRRWIWQIFRPLQQLWEEIDRDDYVRHVYDDREDTLGYGGGLASELYAYWYAKEVALQHGLQYLERWAQGIVIAHVETLRDGKASLPTSSQRMADWLAAFGKMRSRHILVADAKDRVDVKDAPTGGWQAAMEAIRYLDGAMRVAILGSTLPTSQDVTGGSYALAEVQQDTTEALSRFDMTGIEESLRRDLLGWLFRKNKANFEQLGLGDCQLPFLKLREGRQDDHAMRADVLLKARQAGLDIRTSEAYAQLGFSVPAPGDQILRPLGMQESLNQGGTGKPGSGAAADPTSDQGRKVIAAKNEGAANPLRPNNVAGAKDHREQAIDKITGAFAAT